MGEPYRDAVVFSSPSQLGNYVDRKNNTKKLGVIDVSSYSQRFVSQLTFVVSHIC